MLKWDELPQEMQLSEVKPYYQLVSGRKGSLILKRCLDLFLALVLLILTSPLFLILSIWIKLDSKGPEFPNLEMSVVLGYPHLLVNNWKSSNFCQ